MKRTPRPSAGPYVNECAPRRRTNWKGWAAVGVVVALLLGLTALVPTHVRFVTAAVSEAGASTVQVTAQQSYSFSPNLISNVTPGANVTFQLTNGDPSGTAHTFTISSVQGSTIPSGTDITTFLQAHPALFNVWLNSTGTVTESFTTPAKGWYEFVCQEPGHFADGMFGFIAFGEALPSNLTASAPDTAAGAAVFIIVGTIVALVVIALVLGFVVGRRRGSVHEMPPERLGYPEPELPPAPGAPPTNPPPPHQ
jgi:plastocyanin